jgi:cytochrome c oxidase assembly protein subunit 15
VTVSKAWIEMVHRYLATGVGALITLLMLLSWRDMWKGKSQRGLGNWLPTLTFLWVCV